jgi:Protein of unknown function (DUF3048) N-terminal domain/Protein of unknown function (DUF3048) C-terminal domain
VARLRLVALGLACALGLAASACGAGDVAAKAQAEPSTTTTTAVPIPDAPLTGLPDPTGVAQGRSALSVKIENTPEARPQSGLDQADIVYEEVVDGGITRFWAVFDSAAPENIGPVRSVRAMDPGIVSPLHGVVAYSGGTEDNVALIRKAPVVWVDENNAGDAFFREPTRDAPHNLYARSALLWQRGGQPVPPTPMFSYLPKGASFVGEPIASLHANFDQGYDVTYTWDAITSGWKRLQRTNEPFMATGAPGTPDVQVAPTNVIVQFVSYAGAGEGNLYGEGDAWVFSNGQLARGRWSRVYPEVATQFFDAAAQPLKLPPGRTWVELVPVGRTVDLTPGPPAAPVVTTPPTTTPAPKKN